MNSDVWVISDTHFSHKNIIDYTKRPFDDTEEMDNVIIQNWNKLVKPNDLIFHLGDVFFGGAERSKYIAGRLNGRKILIRGNHDKGFSNTKFRKMGFEVYNYYFYRDILLSHYPQAEIPLRTAIANTSLLGNLCGHVHNEGKNLNEEIYKCVCVELTDYKPVNMLDIMVDFSVQKGSRLRGD